MRNQITAVCFFVLLQLSCAQAAENNALTYNLQFSMERSALEGLSLGEEAAEDRLVEKDLELEIDLEYQINDATYLFFTGAVIDETETIESADTSEHVSGFERKRIGLGYFFGEDIRSELNIGRMEFSSHSDWFLWWDEELDGLRLESTFEDFELVLGLTEEQARESTAVDFIDPEQQSVKRHLLSLAWEVSAGHSLIFYHLDQSDDSRSLVEGEFEEIKKIDEEDADLRWSGLSYFGELELASTGLFELEIHTAEVRGTETLYEFDDPSAGLSEVVEKENNRVRGSARSYLVNWTPGFLQDWTFFVGNARGSGDGNPDNRRVGAYRQSGLQDDAEAFGELYQPELSNLEADVTGFNWQVREGIEVSITSFDYRQRKIADEMREVSIEADLTGLSRDLGREIDIVVTIEAENGIEFILTAAEFDPGNAYGAAGVETSSYINLELAFEF
ncbi:MAG: alginate export family protein [Gammaproteobacteria bacterium]|nr:alginate export family protein [Gammaproteobacteria bacterium]